MKIQRILSTLLVWLLFATSTGYAQAQKLSVGVFASPNDRFAKQWVSTSYKNVQRIQRVKTAKPNQNVFLGFVISNYSRDTNKRVNYEVDVAVYDPSGKRIYNERRYAKSRSVAPNAKGYLLVNPVFTFAVENSDPKGNYKFVATVRDLIAKKSATGYWVVKVT